MRSVSSLTFQTWRSGIKIEKVTIWLIGLHQRRKKFTIQKRSVRPTLRTMQVTIGK